MPKTFQEVIMVSRELGVRCLWIDSLCIVQDNEGGLDWMRESSQMHQIYANSYCNLSAADSLDSSGGLGGERHPSMVQTTEATFVPTMPRRGKGEQGLYVLERWRLFNKEVNDCVLNERAWVFQERLLAPRILHFCRYQLFWECRTCVKCEKYPNDTFPTVCWELDDCIKARIPFEGNDLSTLSKSWAVVAESYSFTFLTFPGDKLIALSGIAKRVRSAVEDEYVAGMWRRDFELQLLWFRETYRITGSPPFRPSTYRAPSWSWTSLDGPIGYADHVWDTWSSSMRWIYARRIDKLEYASDDDTAQLLGGCLELRGLLKPVRLVRIGRKRSNGLLEWGIILDNNSEEQVSAFLDEPSTDESVVTRHSDNGDIFCMSVFPAGWDATPKVTPKHMSEEEIRASENDLQWVKGKYLLFRLDNQETNDFERMGIGFCYDQASLDLLHKELDEEVKRALPCLRYEGGRHTIRVI